MKIKSIALFFFFWALQAKLLVISRSVTRKIVRTRTDANKAMLPRLSPPPTEIGFRCISRTVTSIGNCQSNADQKDPAFPAGIFARCAFESIVDKALN